MNLREALQEIHDQRGRLTPTLVVEAAEHPDHPLHERFEWDDTEAARKYRLDQAAGLIRTARIRYVRDSGEKATTRAFIPDRRQPDPFVYAPTADVLTDDLAAAITLREFERAIKALRDRYGHLKEYAALLSREAGAA